MKGLETVSKFALDKAVSSVKALGEGFINDTYVVYCQDAPEYILQRKNHVIFPDVPGMMDNICRVTAHIRAKVSDPLRQTLSVVPALDGKPYFRDDEGNWWVMTLFIKDSLCYSVADSPALSRAGGAGLGRFHRLMADFDEPLCEVIKGFHNIRWRFAQWDEAVAADAAGRVPSLSEEISWIESRRGGMLDFWTLFENGSLPVRVTHNDTKISNFLFDAREEDKPLLCAIDLDTVMSSTLLNDVGDALRSYTNTGAEDDPCLERVGMSMEMFKAYIGGYMAEMKDSLTDTEIKWLAFSGLYITFEQVLRFLMDYINGDTYYKVRYADHNLVRTRAQYKLLRSMEEQLPQMNAFVKACL